MPLTENELVQVIGAPTGGAQRMTSFNGGKNALEDVIATYTEVKRKTSTPSNLYVYLPAPYPTPTLVPATPTKVEIPLTSVFSQDFDYDTVNKRFYLDTAGVTDRKFKLTAHMSMSSSVVNVTAKFMVYKNGSLVTGGIIGRKISTANDLGAVSLNCEYTLSTGDYVEAYIEVDAGTVITLSNMAVTVVEI